MKHFQICQGDVLIESCSPNKLKGLKETKPTVALGEATGHHHSFVGKHAVGFFKEGDDLQIAGGTALADFIEIKGKPSELRHQEHGPIPHDPGTYEKTPQMAWTSEATRPASD